MDMSRDCKNTFVSEIEVFEDIEDAKKRALDISKWNDQLVFISEQLYDVNAKDEIPVAIRLKDGTRISI